MIDYDTDDDGLIEIRYLEQLDAIRHDLIGTGQPKNLSRRAHHRSAFLWAAPGMGCPVDSCGGYELVSDLDFRDPASYASGTVNSEWTEGNGWLPIGLDERKFSTRFDGNGHVISNLYINRVGEDETASDGLFGRTSDASVINNLRLFDVQVSGVIRVGGMVGSNRGRIHSVQVSGNVLGNTEVGGLTGSNLGEIVDSSADVAVSGRNKIGGLVGLSDGRVAQSSATGLVSGDLNVGGLLGWSATSGMIVGSNYAGNVMGTQVLGGLAGRNEGEITRSYSAGTVSGRPVADTQQVGRLGLAEAEAGGLVGLNRGGASITNSYSTAQVAAAYRAGGLVAGNSGTIVASYATGDVTGEYVVGGLLGVNFDGGRIVTSYAVGTATEHGEEGILVGGLVGSNHEGSRVIDSYWNIDTTRHQPGTVRNDTDGSNGVTSTQMQTPTGYTDIYDAWNVDIDNADGDFDPSTGRDDFWDFGTSSQYPALRADFDGDGLATWQEFGDQR